MAKSKQKKLQLQPAEGKIIVRRSSVEETTKGGLLIPDQAKQQTTDGLVVGSHPKNTYPVGSFILFGRYAGTQITFNGEVFLIMDEKDDVLSALVEV